MPKKEGIINERNITSRLRLMIENDDVEATMDYVQDQIDLWHAGQNDEFLIEIESLLDEEDILVEDNLRSLDKQTVWNNWGGNVTVNPFSYFDLRNSVVNDLRQVVTDAITSNKPCKAVGSGHSFSQILQTKGYFLFRSYKKYHGQVISKVDPSLLRTDKGKTLINIACNAKLSEINDALFAEGLAFSNLGSAVLQTYAGAISTSTHGTGIDFPPLCDFLQSVLIIKADGKLARIEPSDGITDPVSYLQRYPDHELIQSDNVFYSIIVSMGCMGIAIEMTTEVEKVYLLKETRTLTTWKKVRKTLTDDPDYYLKKRHFDIILNPYPDKNGNINCILTEREVVPITTPRNRQKGKAGRLFFALIQRLVCRLINHHPQLIPKFLDIALKNLQIPAYIDYSSAIFDMDDVNKVKAVSSEYFYPLTNNVYLDGIDDLILQVSQNQAKKLYQTSPLGIRFVNESKAYLSMAYGRKTCTVECPLMKGSFKWEAVLDSYETNAILHSARPHWGQFHKLVTEPGWLELNYKDYKIWIDTLEALDPDKLFENKFTEEMHFRELSVSYPFWIKKTKMMKVKKSGVSSGSSSSSQAKVEKMIKALIDDFYESPDLPPKKIYERTISTLASFDPMISNQLLSAVSAATWFLPLLVGSLRPYYRLPRAKRLKALAKCYTGSGIKRDIGQALKLIMVFPYYTDDLVRNKVGYVPFEDRPRSIGLDLTPSTHLPPP